MTCSSNDLPRASVVCYIDIVENHHDDYDTFMTRPVSLELVVACNTDRIERISNGYQ